MPVPSGSPATIAAMSSGGMCLAASMRKPSIPRESRSSRYAGDRRADALGLGGQVGQVHQLAGLHLSRVLVAGDVVVRGQPAVVEVGVRPDPGVLVVRVRRARPPGAGRVLAGHVVDHRVGPHVDARVVARLHHRRVLLARAQPRLHPVAHRLVRRPPLLAHDVLLRGAGEHPRVAVRAEGVGALRGDRVPRPLEQLDSDVTTLVGGGRLRRARAGGEEHQRTDQGGRTGGQARHRHHPERAATRCSNLQDGPP